MAASAAYYLTKLQKKMLFQKPINVHIDVFYYSGPVVDVVVVVGVVEAVVEDDEAAFSASSNFR